MKLKKITWEFSKPDHFPCIICGEREAIYIRHENGYNMPLCQECANLPWAELLKKGLWGKKKHFRHF